jgi:alpha-glucosidase
MLLPAHALPHHDGSPLYVSTAAPTLGETVQVRVRIPRSFGDVPAVRTRSNPDHEPRFTDAVVVPSEDGWSWWQAPVTVENPVHGYRFMITRADGSSVWLNATGVYEIETLDAEDFKLVAYDPAPSWVSSTVLYQIFPDRFARSAAADARPTPDWAIPAAWSDPVDLVQPGRSQQFYGGDLDGIIEHLDHLTQLGISTIYITPVFPARSNHRYDASSFAEVDPILGGDDAYIRLIEAAHARGLKVIGDLTTNHCGDAHEWFQAAHGHPDAPESEFFYWLNDEHTEYVSWLGVPSLPKFNWNSAELRRRFIDGPDSVVARWLKPPYALDGWRIDVANMTGRYRDQDLNPQVRRTIRRTMVEINPDTILLGESTNDAASDFQGDAWHGAMTYANFTRPLWGWLSEPGSESSYFGQPVGTIPMLNGEQFLAAHTQFIAGFPWRTMLGTMNALDTHDVPRFLTHARPGTVPVAFGMSVTFPGIPVVWAGDEFALTGEDGEASRTPLPWDALDDSARDTIDLYARLIHLRREHPALNGGGMRWVHVDPDVLVYVREAEDESILVLAARSDVNVRLPLHAVSGADGARPVFGDVALQVGPSVDEDDGGIRIETAGPVFAAWQLPGVRGFGGN